MDSSPEMHAKKNTKGKLSMPFRPALKKPSRSAPEPAVPLYVDEDEPWNVNDGSTLTL
jgi:hypothetical protein